MLTEWNRMAGSGVQASRELVRTTPFRPSRLSAFICFWRVGEVRRPVVERLDDHLLRDIGMTRTELNFMSLAPKRRP